MKAYQGKARNMKDVERQDAIAHILKDCKFEIECLEEDIDYRGNCSASGDDVEDKKQEDWIQGEFERGNSWAWCCIRLSTRLGNFVGVDYVGACSYYSEKDFIECSGYYQDMKCRTASNLLETLENNYQQSREALQSLGVDVP